MSVDAACFIRPLKRDRYYITNNKMLAYSQHSFYVQVIAICTTLLTGLQKNGIIKLG